MHNWYFHFQYGLIRRYCDFTSFMLAAKCEQTVYMYNIFYYGV